MDNINMSERQLATSIVLGAAIGVLAATMPVEVESGFDETRAAVGKVLECGDTNFSADDTEVVNYSYVQAQDVESDQIKINEAVKLIIDNSN